MLQALEADLDFAGGNLVKSSDQVPDRRRPLDQAVDDGASQGISASPRWACLAQHVEVAGRDPAGDGGSGIDHFMQFVVEQLFPLPLAQECQQGGELPNQLVVVQPEGMQVCGLGCEQGSEVGGCRFDP